MMGERRVDQAALFYTFSLEDHVPANHLLRSIDRFVELEGLRAHLAPFYSAIGRPSIDPDPPSVWWTPMLAFRSWRGVSDECSTPELSGFFQARGR